MGNILEKAVAKFKASGWAESTKRVYRSQLQCYLNFCAQMDIVPVPVSFEGISMYIAYLAHIKGLRFCTIDNYLVIVKHLHRAEGAQDPIDNWHVKHLLQGVKRVLGTAQVGAELVTPDMLLTIKKHLNLYNLLDLSVWCACLIGFFGLLRPGNFLVRDKSVPILRIGQVESCKNNFHITFNYTKTIQFREKELNIILPNIPGHPLCPASALYRLLSLHVLLGSDGQTPLLCQNIVKPLNYNNFILLVNQILAKAGYQLKLTGHSFRRGGATWAFQVGLPGEIIQDLGMWKSNAYLRYIETDHKTKQEAMIKFGESLPE